jgi:S-DNA-T family DNA segregation ATPase FtsK/SpoIIIE
VDVITGLIKANFPARISFAVTSQVDSRVILDTQGAEKLLGRGDMLFMSPESSTLLRLQGCFVSDEELQRLVAYWKERAGDTEDVREHAPWAEMEEAGDELLDQAIDLARERQSISISFLQRHLRIGYPRAARLVDQLEQQGVVGPAVNGGRSRDVLVEDEDRYDEEEGDEGTSSD